MAGSVLHRSSEEEEGSWKAEKVELRPGGLLLAEEPSFVVVVVVESLELAGSECMDEETLLLSPQQRCCSGGGLLVPCMGGSLTLSSKVGRSSAVAVRSSLMPRSEPTQHHARLDAAPNFSNRSVEA
jgi:hypothetical protein